MKKSLILFISLYLAYGVTLSQNIENKLGAGGTFAIKDADDKELFLFTKDIVGEPDLIIGKDPYAWAKGKAFPNIESQQNQIPQQATAQLVPQEAVVAQQTSQHPGWLWNAEQNQWVPDPDYVNNNQ